MYPLPNKVILCGKDNLLVKCWQPNHTFYPTMSVVAAAGFQTLALKLDFEKVQKIGKKTAILSWSILILEVST